jgi:excisionase family DNA binding protein
MRKTLNTNLEKQLSDVLTRKELKELFSISYPTILKYEKKGLLQGYRLGNRILFKRSEVENALSPRKFNNNV